MPYTTFETFNIDIYEIAKSYIVKICSTFKITLLNVNSKSDIERLPEDHQLCRDFDKPNTVMTTVSIYCMDISKFSNASNLIAL